MKIFYALLLFISPIVVSAQTGRVEYDFKLAEMVDYPVKGSLYFNGPRSYFKYQEKPATTINGQLVSDEDTDHYDSIGSLVYTNQSTQTFVQRVMFKDSYYIVNDDELQFNWEIRSENKKIQGFNCQVAILEHRGRYYKAWFTADIPASVGPWKFFGLPGLILELRDFSGDVFFNATKVEIPSDVSLYNFDEFSYGRAQYQWADYKRYKLRILKKRIDFMIARIMEDDDGTGSVEAGIRQTEVFSLDSIN